MAILAAAAISGSNVTEWAPNKGPQTEILSRSEKELFYGGARGGGKTEAGIAWIGEPEYISHPGYKGLVLRKNSLDLSDWLLRTSRFYGDLIEIKGNPATIHWRQGGITRTGHLKDPRSIEAYQGHEYQKVLVEELTQIPEEKLYLELLGSCRSKIPELRPQVLSTGNPGGRGHNWVKKRFVLTANNKPYRDEKGNWRIYIPSTVDDCPQIIENDPDYVKYLDSLPEPLRSAWRFGNWDLFVGQYFLNFGNHLCEQPYNIQPCDLTGRLFLSFDYGYGMTGKSSAGLWYLNEDNRPTRMATWYREGLTVSEQAADLVEWVASFPHTGGAFPCEAIYDTAMNAAGSTSEDQSAPVDYFRKAFKKYGTVWTAANKQRINGWQITLDFFGKDERGEPKLTYWPDYNATFSDSFENLVHDANNPSDVLKCDFDHPADETRYMLVHLRQKIAQTENQQTVIRPRASAIARVASSFAEVGLS